MAEGNRTHEALGRAARRLSYGGGLYLGGGVAAERIRGRQGAESYRVTAGGKTQTHPGPLSAAVHAFSAAGQSQAPDTPGGTKAVADPAAAARLRELSDEEATTRADLQRYEAQVKARENAPIRPVAPGLASDGEWEQRRIAELKVELAQLAKERAELLSGKDDDADSDAKGGGALTEAIFGAYACWALAEWNEEPVEESAKTAALSVTHAPIGKGGSNWITKSKPGNTGQLPAYIQNVRNAIMRDGTEESRATAIAIGRVRDWAEGKGNVGPEVKAAAAKAIAEWEAMRAKAKASKVAESEPFGVGALVEAFAANPAVAGAMRAGGKAGSAPKRSPSVASFDTAKHPRGSKGTGTGGKFISKTSGTSSQVRTVQHHLGIATDGKFGSQTHEAVRRFQQRHGLVADGVVGRQTMAAFAGRKDAATVKPGALSGADSRELTRIRTVQTRRRASPPPSRSMGGRVI